jgi:uncharacterized Zn finger protein (UPF0148 family)
MSKKEKTRKCLRCGSTYFKENKTKGEIVCAKCGLIMEDIMVDTEPEIIGETNIEDIRPEMKSKKANKKEDMKSKTKLKILRLLAKHTGKLVPMESIPNMSPSLMDGLLKEGLIGVEKLKNGKINCMITRRGYKLSKRISFKNNP